MCWGGLSDCAASNLHDADVVVMVMLVVGRESFLERRDGLLEVLALVCVFALNVCVHAHWHRVLTVHYTDTLTRYNTSDDSQPAPALDRGELGRAGSPGPLRKYWLPTDRVLTCSGYTKWPWKCLQNGGWGSFSCTRLYTVLRRRTSPTTVCWWRKSVDICVCWCMDARTCVVPRTRTQFGDRSYVAGPQVWNSLPAPLRDTNSIYSFRKQLKTFLFSGGCRAQWLCFCALQILLLTYKSTNRLEFKRQFRCQFKFVLDCKVRELKKQIEPRDKDIKGR